MPKKILAATLLALAIAALSSAQAPTTKEHRVALVIGNGSYAASPLRNPSNDARDLSAALKNLGFTVTTLVDADQKTMKRTIDEFGLAISGAKIALFYYSGHGVQISGQNYLIPTGASITSSADVEYEAIELGRILAKMEGAQAETNILILDACRDNPLPAAARGGSRGLAIVDKKPPESIIVYATEASETASDGAGRNGTFTEALLRNIGRGEDFATILLDVKAEVRKATGNLQRPANYENLTHKVYLRPSASGSAELLVRSDPAGADIFINGTKSGLAGEVIANLGAGTELAIEARSGGLVARAGLTLGKGELRELFLRLEQPKGHLLLSARLPTGASLEGATVAFDGQSPGTFGSGIFRDLAAGRHEAVLRGKGLLWKGVVEVPDGRTASLEIYPQEVGNLEVRAPADATVTVTDPSSAVLIQRAGDTNAVDLPVGSYALEVSGAVYEAARTTVAITRGGTVRWEPWTSGNLVVTTDPPGFDIQIEGRITGKSPLSLKGLSPGTLRVSVAESTEYLGIEQKANIELGRISQVSFTLKPRPASLSVSVPEGAPVSIEGAGYSKSAIGPCSFADLPAGSYVLKAGGTGGFEAYEASLVLRRGEKKNAVPWTAGKLTIFTEPSGASIWIEGKIRGTSPLELADIPKGKLDIEIRYPGFIDTKYSLDVVAGKVTLFRLQLMPLKAIDPLEMVEVKGGIFMMGGLEITISGFRIGKYEVTQGLWESVIGSNNSRFRGENRLPVENILWSHAVEFCNYLSMKEGLTPCYSWGIFGSRDPRKWPRNWWVYYDKDDWKYYNDEPVNDIICHWNANGFRLPTEAEWEYAARSRERNVILPYAGGSDPDLVSWYSQNSGMKTHPVGLKAPNSLGLFDMSGNVAELCWNFYSDYRGTTDGFETMYPTKYDYSVRGGSFVSSTREIRCVYRGAGRGGWENVGFRIVKR